MDADAGELNRLVLTVPKLFLGYQAVLRLVAAYLAVSVLLPWLATKRALPGHLR